MVNFLGVVAALSAFVGIWFGHVAVRKLEFLSPSIWLPSLLFAAAGAGLEIVSLLAPNREFSLASGILGMTFLWDAFEFFRQQRRVRRGHAPANLQNPRHALFLSSSPSATSLDLLKRQPVGRPVSETEAVQMLEGRP